VGPQLTEVVAGLLNKGLSSLFDKRRLQVHNRGVGCGLLNVLVMDHVTEQRLLETCAETRQVINPRYERKEAVCHE
jgi:hypothetical protein